MTNRRQQPVDTLQDKRRQRTRSATKTDGSDYTFDPDAVVLPPEGQERAIDLPEKEAIPKCPPGLSVATQRKWEVFWASPLRQYVIQADVATMLDRYFRTLDINDRAYGRFQRQWYGKGSTGQKTASPDWQIYRESSRLLDSLESQIGIGPLARMRLNISFGEAAESLADVLRALRAPGDGEDDGEWIEVGPDGDLEFGGME